MSLEVVTQNLGRVHSLEETAQALRMSVDQVRKTEIRAIEKLRRNQQLRELASQAGVLKESETSCSE